MAGGAGGPRLSLACNWVKLQRVQKMNTKNIFSSVIANLDAICNEIKTSLKEQQHQLNERYVHHRLSFYLQGDCSLFLNEGSSGVPLLPEWPTWKSGTQIKYRKYRNFNNLKNDKFGYHTISENEQSNEGSAGFIDFCIGHYEKPEIAIELILKNGWSSEEVIYDFIKILDEKLPFNSGVAYCIILRVNGLSYKKRLEKFKKSINTAYNSALERLSHDVSKKRDFRLIVVEIAPDAVRKWVRSPKDMDFMQDPPTFCPPREVQ